MEVDVPAQEPQLVVETVAAVASAEAPAVAPAAPEPAAPAPDPAPAPAPAPTVEGVDGGAEDMDESEGMGGVEESEPAADGADGSRAAEDGDEPPLKKIKKPTSAFFFFCSEKRDELKAATPELGMTDMQKALGTAWKALENTAREPYTKQAADDKERYAKEISETATKLGVSEAELRASDVATKKTVDEIGPTEIVIPVSRVKRIVKLDPEVKNISKEATALIAKATELFLAKFGEDAYKMSSLSGRRTLKPEDIKESVASLPQYEWLRDDISVANSNPPPAPTAASASSSSTSSSSSSSTSSSAAPTAAAAAGAAPITNFFQAGAGDGAGAVAAAPSEVTAQQLPVETPAPAVEAVGAAVAQPTAPAAPPAPEAPVAPSAEAMEEVVP